jgi:5'-phosphate synthase pdxT subunit
VRRTDELARCRALVLPGGETTTMHRLLRSSGLWQPLLEFAAGHALLGTCAGAILMARVITDSGGVEPLGILDVTLQRNAYGRQVDSFEAELGTTVTLPQDFAQSQPARGVFIRAPRILALGQGVEVLAVHEQEPVAVRSGRHMALTFHPELRGDPRWHQLWLASSDAGR